MENKEQLHKTIGSRRTRSKQYALGKDNTLKRLPLRQLQIHAITPSLLAGEKKKTPGDVKQVSKAVSRENVSCQTENTDSREMCTAENPSEKYWETIAEKRRVALAETLKENMELHKEVQRLKETVKTLENQNSDAEYFAMMYNITRSSDT